MTSLIQKNGTLYTITNNGDSKEDFNSKLKFIFSDLSNDKNDFESRYTLSRCFLNHKKLGVEYPKHIMDIINK